MEIPNQKRIEFSLQYIYGVGHTTAKAILVETVSFTRNMCIPVVEGIDKVSFTAVTYDQHLKSSTSYEVKVNYVYCGAANMSHVVHVCI